MKNNQTEVNQKNATALAEAIKHIRTAVSDQRKIVDRQQLTITLLHDEVSKIKTELLMARIAATGNGPTEDV